MGSVARRHQKCLVAALLGCIWCLLYPTWAAPFAVEQRLAETAAGLSNFQSRQPSLDISSSAPPISISSSVGTTLEPLRTQRYFCRSWPGGPPEGSCNTCYYRPNEIHPADPSPLPNGDSAQARLEGTNVTTAELIRNEVRFLQVGGDWWNKCGDGWLNADFIYTRLPVGFICEDWRTGRYILRQDAGRRWPFEDNSFEIVYSEHMFEHILPMDGSTFLKEMYRILKPGGVLRITTPDLEKYLKGYMNRNTDSFLQAHAARFPPMGKLGPPFTAATVVNNIFRKCATEPQPPINWSLDFCASLLISLRSMRQVAHRSVVRWLGACCRLLTVMITNGYMILKNLQP